MTQIDRGHRAAFRNAVIEREMPRSLLGAGAILIVISVLGLVLDAANPQWPHAMDLVVGLAFLGTGALARSSRLSAQSLPWIMALLALVIVGNEMVQVQIDPLTIPLAIALVVMAVYGPMTLAWRPMLVVGVIMVILFWSAIRASPAGLSIDWAVAAVVAVLVSGVQLRVRLSSIDSLAEMTADAEARATTDPLTGTLNRHGFDALAPALLSSADRQGRDVFAAFVDVDGLKAANDVHGHDFGDSVLVAVSEAIRLAARQDDLVARWGGDEFLVAGVGPAPDADALSSRLVALLQASSLDRAKWPGTVSVGVASAPPRGLDVDVLIAMGDEDMYLRRGRR